MKVYTFSEARAQLATLLDQARVDGEARIRRRDGQVFVVQPVAPGSQSPLDVPGIDVGAAAGTAVSLVRESRRAGDRYAPVRKAAKRRPRKPRREPQREGRNSGNRGL